MNLDSLYIGKEYKDYTALCVDLGEKAAGGNSKPAQIARFKRHFDWKKVGKRSLVITDIYQEPMPEALRSDDKYSDDILICLRWDSQKRQRERGLSGSIGITYSLPQILTICGFVSPQWTTRTEELESNLAEFKRNGAFEVSHLTGSNKDTRWFLNMLDSHIRQYCSNCLDRSLDRLMEKGYLEAWGKQYWVKRNGDSRHASPEEERQCRRIEAEVKESLGISFLNVYNSARYYKEFSRRIKERLGFDGAYQLRRVAVKASFETVSEAEYENARKRVNENSVAQFEKAAEADAKKDMDELWSLLEKSEDPTLREMMMLFSYTPEGLYEASNRFSAEDSIEARKALISWFVSLDGAEDYMRHHAKFEHWMQAQVEKTHTK